MTEETPIRVGQVWQSRAASDYLTERQTSTNTLILCPTDLYAGARVTRLQGTWGYWSNGKRTQVGPDRATAEAAARVHVIHAATTDPHLR